MNHSSQVERVHHQIARGPHFLYAVDYQGEGPAFVLLHGFPDNHHIYDRLIPELLKRKRRVIAFDFLGFGESDKPSPYKYSFSQQEEDLEAVADYFKLDSFVPVAHDSGGVAAIRFLFKHRDRIERLCLLNTFFADNAALRFPELIAFFAEPKITALARAVLTSPQEFTWLLAFQNQHFKASLSPELQRVHDEFLQPIVAHNFTQKPGAGYAFAQITADLYPALKENTEMRSALSGLNVPVFLIWGKGDPYLNEGVAEDFTQLFQNAMVTRLDAGHWPQIDNPEEVAAGMC